MRVDDFDFVLPDGLIAARPARPRDAARLLLVGEEFEHRRIRDLPRLLAPGDLLVVNDTKVIPARLRGRRGEAKVEATLHKRLGEGRWRAFVRPGKRVREGDELVFADGLTGRVTQRPSGREADLDFAMTDAALQAALARHGAMPLPPYIPRPDGADAQDRDDYQTLFAAEPGAVAAPTAALHFTPDLVAALEARGVEIAKVTLHVGAGTFLPVDVEDTDDHRMHSEYGEVSAQTADKVNGAARVVAVGTTVLRILESAAGDDGVAPFAGETDIFITPGFRFRAVDRLLTNFHLPRSTLFMLVSAFAGLERMQAAYAEAIAERYRFYSYGDACLLSRSAP
ncbi:MAG: tRNA preQ1(34) S-adenosylmethionine ribosyltransferase-isomerase QueA [Alphaproteobacteria bacterium]|nr:tRNA preQ1(34) S-adenosylmethionine ribosyltransferase-isomerase QueA [Alphaproteobacteria bacterium]